MLKITYYLPIVSKDLLLTIVESPKEASDYIATIKPLGASQIKVTEYAGSPLHIDNYLNC